MHRTTAAIALTVSAGLTGAAAADDLYFATAEALIWTFNTDTGSIENPVACAVNVEALALQGRDILVGDTNGLVQRVNLDTFAVSWMEAPGPVLSMARWGNTLYLTTDDGHMHWLHADDLSNIDTYYIQDPLQATVLFGGTIYTGSWSTAVYDAPIGDLTLEWFTVCGGRVNSMATDGTDLLIGSLEGTVYVFDATTGAYKATWPVDSDCVGMHYTDDRLFIAGSDGVIHRMNLASGQVDATYDTGFTITAMTGSDGCAADFNADGEVSTLDFLDFLNAWADNDVAADMDNNGTINTQDVLVFLNAFTSGCE